MSGETLRIGLVQYEVGHARTFEEFMSRVEDLADTAQADGAQLVAFPEYLSADLLVAAASGRDVRTDDMPQVFAALNELFTDYVAAMSELACKTGIFLIAGSFPRQRHTENGYRNAAQIFGPNGEYLEQPKLHVAYELQGNRGLVQPGQGQLVFDALGATMSVIVCYDAQFPETARAVVATKDVDLLVVIGCAMEPWGTFRLRTATAARAMESLSFGANVQIAGRLPIPIDQPYQFWAHSTIVSPISRPFDPTGVLAESKRDIEDVIVASLDLDRLRWVRQHGYPALDERHVPVRASVESFEAKTTKAG